MYRLPQEIIYLFVDAISAGNRADLFRVALTACAFLQQAQSHLFRSIKVEVSYCIQQTSKDWDAFHKLLLQSPNIKFYIREIFVNSLIFSHELYHYTRPKSWPCPHHAGPQKRHLLSPKLVE